MKVLIAEDNALNVEVVKDLLELEGHTVAVASDGVQAIEMARRLSPDVVLMDVHMPRLDGIEATRRLREDPATHAIPVIALTASAMPDERRQILEAGCIGSIAKPIDVMTMTNEIGRLLHAYRPVGTHGASEISNGGGTQTHERRS